MYGNVFQMNNGISINETSQSRIDKFYVAYRHLLNSKVPQTENLRMHAVDVRPRGNNKENGNLLFDVFAYLCHVVYIIMGNGYWDLFENLLKPSDYTILLYDSNVDKFKEWELAMHEVLEFLTNDDEFEVVEKILSGNQEVFDALKITKQKNKYLEDNGENIEFNTSLQNSIDNIYLRNSNTTINYLKYTRDYLKSIDHIKDTHTYMKYVVEEFIKDRYRYDLKNQEPIDAMMETLSTYMDTYTMYRMLRNFDGKMQNNIIFYGGYNHANNIFKILKSTGYFDYTIKKEINMHTPNDCQKLNSH